MRANYFPPLNDDLPSKLPQPFVRSTRAKSPSKLQQPHGKKKKASKNDLTPKKTLSILRAASFTGDTKALQKVGGKKAKHIKIGDYLYRIDDNLVYQLLTNSSYCYQLPSGQIIHDKKNLLIKRLLVSCSHP